MKKIATNNFSSAILSDLEAFHWEIKSVDQSSEGRLTFEWYWYEYNGFGEILYVNGRVNTTLGHDDSSLRLSQTCRNKNPGLKGTCSLYNDKGLERLFNYILEKESLI